MIFLYDVMYGLSNNVLLLQNRDLWEVRVGQEASLREARGQLSCRDEEVGSRLTLGGSVKHLSTAAGGEAEAGPGRREAGEGDGGDRGQRPGQAGPPGQSKEEEF